MTPTIILWMTLLYVLNFGALAMAAFWFRSKHRLLFARLLDLNKRLTRLQETEIANLRDDVRRHHRLLEMAKAPRRNPHHVLPSWFTAQAGEDILIYDFFREQNTGFFVEAGAGDGVGLSNTYLLESLGWRGLLVEPVPAAAEACRKNRPRSIVEQAALGADGCNGEVEFTCADDPKGGAYLSFLESSHQHVQRCQEEGCVLRKVRVPLKSLNSLLEGRCNRIDLLSLDVEGMELTVLKGLALDRFQPKLILIEYQWDERDKALDNYLNEKGYVATARKGTNVFYVPFGLRQKLASLLCEGETFPN